MLLILFAEKQGIKYRSEVKTNRIYLEFITGLNMSAELDTGTKRRQVKKTAWELYLYRFIEDPKHQHTYTLTDKGVEYAESFIGILLMAKQLESINESSNGRLPLGCSELHMTLIAALEKIDLPLETLSRHVSSALN